MKKLFTIIVATLLVASLQLNAQWTQIGSDIDGEAAYDNSGRSVSLSSDGSIVAIGAPGNEGNGAQSGHVRVYENLGGSWSQIGQDIDGEAINNGSGSSVSISSDGSIVAIGASGNEANGQNTGHVRIYENQSGTWIQIGQDIDGDTTNDCSGKSVSLSSDGSIVAIGAPQDCGTTGAGYVRIYKNLSGSWTQIGTDIDGEAADDHFGSSVSLSSDGSIVAIGAYGNDSNGTNAGHVRIYENISGTWTQIGQDIEGEATYDMSGYSVSLSSDGSVVAIGATYNDNIGHVRVYENQSGSWTQLGSDIDGETEWDEFGHSVSINSDGSVVAIGGPYNAGNSSDAGHVRVYKNLSGSWTQIGQDIDGEATDDHSGSSVSISSDGSVVAIGAPYNVGNGTDAGHVRIYTNPNVGVDEISNMVDVGVYPNPNKGSFVVENIKDYSLLRITNMIGDEVYKKEINTNSIEINIASLPKGIYFLHCIANDKRITEKIIIE